MDRVEQKLQDQGNRVISKAVKVALLKTFAQMIPKFWTNLFLLSNDVCDSIETQMNGFQWVHGVESKGIRWKSQDKLCAMKEGGGLGFRRLRNFYIAMIAMEGWRLVNNDNLLVKDCLKAR